MKKFLTYKHSYSLSFYFFFLNNIIQKVNESLVFISNFLPHKQLQKYKSILFHMQKNPDKAKYLQGFFSLYSFYFYIKTLELFDRYVGY